MAVVKFFSAVNMNQLQGYNSSDDVLLASATEIRIGVAGNEYDSYVGTGFTYNNQGVPTGGTVTAFTSYSDLGVTKLATVTGISLSLVEVLGYINTGNLTALRQLTFGGDDKFTGSSGADLINSYEGDDTLDGGAGVDTMTGGDGSDTYHVRNVGDLVKETTAESTTGDVDTALSYLSAYTLTTGVERGKIAVDTAANLTGNGLDNRLFAGAGNNQLTGAGGIDTADYSGASAKVSVSLDIAGAQATGGSGSDTLASIEDLLGSAFNDKLTGNASANRLDGGAGADTLTGGNGNDIFVVREAADVVKETNASLSSGGTDVVFTYASSFTLSANVENARVMSTGIADVTGNGLDNRFYAGSGNNVFDGAGGIDTVDYGGATAKVTVSLAIGGAQATGGSGSDTLTLIEDLVGSEFKDKLTGSAAINKLDGGAGADTLTGGDGNDIFVVRQSGDLVIESNAALETGGLDVVYSYLSSYTLPTNVENGRIMSTGAADLYGNNLDNRLFAGSGDNVLGGGPGGLLDTVDYSGAASGVTVSLALDGPQATGGSGTDTLITIDALTGSDHADQLSGDTGNNVLSGGAGDDTLNGATGMDTLVGGAGFDVFVIDDVPTALEGADRFRDFVAGEDTLQLDGAVFTELTGGALSAGEFVANTSGVAVDEDDYIVYDTDSGRLYYDYDGSGANASTLIAVLTTLPTLSSDDVFVG